MKILFIRIAIWAAIAFVLAIVFGLAGVPANPHRSVSQTGAQTLFA